MEKLAEITLYNQRMDKSYGVSTINASWLKITHNDFELKIEDMNEEDFYAVIRMLMDDHIDYQVFGERTIYISGSISQIVGIHWYK